MWCRQADGGRCPNCGIFIERSGGCNHMTCRCRHEYCWLCGKSWGSCDCPLYGGNKAFEDATMHSRFRANDKTIRMLSLYALGCAICLVSIWHSSWTAPSATVPKSTSGETARGFASYFERTTGMSYMTCLLTTTEAVLGAVGFWRTSGYAIDGKLPELFVCGFQPNIKMDDSWRGRAIKTTPSVLLLISPFIVPPMVNILTSGLAWCLAFVVQLLAHLWWLWPLHRVIGYVAAWFVLLIPACVLGLVEAQIIADLAIMSGMHLECWFAASCSLNHILMDVRIAVHLMLVTPALGHTSEALWALLDAAFSSAGLWDFGWINPLVWLRGTQVNVVALCVGFAVLVLVESELNRIPSVPSFVWASILKHGRRSLHLCAVLMALLSSLGVGCWLLVAGAGLERLLYQSLGWLLYPATALHAVVFCVMAVATLSDAALSILQRDLGACQLARAAEPIAGSAVSDRFSMCILQCVRSQSRLVAVVIIMTGLMLQALIQHFHPSIGADIATAHRALLLAATPSAALLLAELWVGRGWPGRGSRDGRCSHQPMPEMAQQATDIQSWISLAEFTKPTIAFHRRPLLQELPCWRQCRANFEATVHQLEVSRFMDRLRGEQGRLLEGFRGLPEELRERRRWRRHQLRPCMLKRDPKQRAWTQTSARKVRKLSNQRRFG